MKQIITAFMLVLLLVGAKTQAQNTRPDKLYSMSGIGFALPVGPTTDYYKAKFSTELGANIGIGNAGWFLYPKVSFQTFSFNQIKPDNGFTYTAQKGRSTTYLLNVALGYRKIVNSWAFYGFVGAGGGTVLNPQLTVDNNTLQVTTNNKSSGMGTAEGGAGIEYNLGGLNIFVESSYMYGFSKIQDKTFNVVPISIGIKPNLSSLFKK